MKQKKWNLSALPGNLLVFLYSIIVIVPLYFILVTSFKTNTQVIKTPFALPSDFNFDNFIAVLSQGGIARSFLNTVVISVAVTVIQLLMAVVITYCLYKIRDYKLGVILYMVVLVTMFIPGTGWVTMIRLYQKLGLYNSPLGLILQGGTGRLAFNMFILFGAIRAVPRELEEAATLDGCNDAQYLFRVLLPCVRPSLTSIGIFSFTAAWNSLMIPLMLIRDREWYTIPMALRFFQNLDTRALPYNYIFAGVLLSALPLVILYLFCQKYFVSALAGSVKG